MKGQIKFVYFPFQNYLPDIILADTPHKTGLIGTLVYCEQIQSHKVTSLNVWFNRFPWLLLIWKERILLPHPKVSYPESFTQATIVYKATIICQYCQGLYILLVEGTGRKQNNSSTGKRVLQRTYVQQATPHHEDDGEETSGEGLF